MSFMCTPALVLFPFVVFCFQVRGARAIAIVGSLSLVMDVLTKSFSSSEELKNFVTEISPAVSGHTVIPPRRVTSPTRGPPGGPPPTRGPPPPCKQVLDYSGGEEETSLV